MSNRKLGILFGIFFGWLGVQKFFTRNYVGGIFMVIFTLTGIPALIGLIDAIRYSRMTDEEFDERYFGRSRFSTTYDPNQRHIAREEAAERERIRQENLKKAEIRRKQNEVKREEALKKIQTILELRKKGVREYKDFDLNAAEDTFRSIIKLDPKDIPALFNLACISGQTERPQKAFEFISRAVQNGFSDFDRIETHPAFSAMRLEPSWEDFRRRGYQIVDQFEKSEEDDLLEQIKQSRSIKKADQLLEEILNTKNKTSS